MQAHLYEEGGITWLTLDPDAPQEYRQIEELFAPEAKRVVIFRKGAAMRNGAHRIGLEFVRGPAKKQQHAEAEA